MRKFAKLYTRMFFVDNIMYTILRGGIYSNDQECKGRQMKFVNIDKGIDA